jgi:hypothetical protein
MDFPFETVSNLELVEGAEATNTYAPPNGSTDEIYFVSVRPVGLDLALSHLFLAKAESCHYVRRGDPRICGPIKWSETSNAFALSEPLSEHQAMYQNGIILPNQILFQIRRNRIGIERLEAK